MPKNTITSAISIFFLAAGIVLSIFIVLSGAVNSSPMNKVYFLQASTAGISGSGPSVPNPARWTYFSICSARNGNNAACGKVTAAQPFDPRRNFGTRNGLPDQFANGGSMYYYESRVAWAFYIIALFFAVMALLLSVTALCSRLAAKFTGMMTIIALVAQAVAAALMTYASPPSPNPLPNFVLTDNIAPGPSKPAPSSAKTARPQASARTHTVSPGRPSSPGSSPPCSSA